MYFEVLVGCNNGEKDPYTHYYAVEAKDIVEATRKASNFISTYYIGEDKGTLLLDHTNIAYRFSDNEIVELYEINETTPEAFLKDRAGKLFLIA